MSVASTAMIICSAVKMGHWLDPAKELVNPFMKPSPTVLTTVLCGCFLVARYGSRPASWPSRRTRIPPAFPELSKPPTRRQRAECIAWQLALGAMVKAAVGRRRAHASVLEPAHVKKVSAEPNGTRRCDMARIEGEILIGRPVEEVFDFVADSRNEPSFNRAMAGVELLTSLPIGQGTRFRARMGRAGMQMLVELSEFDRPHRLGSRTTSPMMRTSGALTFAAYGDGTVMRWAWQVRLRGWMRMLGPLFGPLGGRMERRIWTSMKRYLENTAAGR